MKQLILFILINCFLISCINGNHERNLNEKIKGSWVNDTSYYSFSDSSLTHFTYKGNYDEKLYSIYNDTIFISESNSLTKASKYYLYYATIDTLKLYSYVNKQRKKIVLYKSNKFIDDLIIIDTLEYASHFCFWGHPNFLLKVFHKNNIEYFGFQGRGIDSIGRFIGTVTKNQMNILETLISRIDENSLFITRDVVLDTWYRGLSVSFYKYNARQKIIYSLFFEDESRIKSHELNLLWRYMTNIYREATLRRTERFKKSDLFNKYSHYSEKYFIDFRPDPRLNATASVPSVIKY